MSKFSNYPHGFTGGVTLRGMPITVAYPGKVFFLNSTSVLAATDDGVAGADSTSGGAYQRPFASLNFAVNQCVASRGDIIMVMPGHTETISTATATAMDVAGVVVVGLGSGTLRPKFTLDTTTAATIAVSAANVSFKNVIFNANFADIASLFTPTAANFLCEDCVFTQEAAAVNFVAIAVTSTTDNEADGLSLIRCQWIEVDAATTSLVNVDADLDGLLVHDCHIDLGVNGVLSAIAEIAAGKDLTNVDIRRNYVSRLVTASAVQLLTFVDTTTTNTGIIEGNHCRSLDIAGELLLSAGTNISLYDNKSTSVIDLSGYLLPAADA